MKVYDAASIRNVTIAGHSGAGKTQLAAAILFDAGMVNRFGRVDDGTTVTDFDEEEVARKHTLAASLAYAEWNKHKINLIDTPGFGNFLSDTLAAMRVCDAAAVVVDAVSGVEVQTEKVWQAAEEYELPRLVVVNRLDRERASLSRTLESLTTAFGRTVIPVQLPIGEEKSFKGVVDLVGMKAYVYETDGSGKFKEEGVPAAMADDVQAAREALVEMVAEADDKLMEKFFEEGTLTQDELVSGLRTAVLSRRIFPLLCTSSILNIGVHPLLDAFIAYVPAPTERAAKGTKGGQEVDVNAADGGPYAAFVWKTVADPFAGRISMFRVMSGSLKADTTVFNLTKEAPERLGHLALMQGKTQTDVPEIKAGDMGAVAKLKETVTNDTLTDKGGVAFKPMKFPEPVLSYAIEPKSRGDEDKISSSLQRLQEEDPTIRSSRDPQTKELLLSGQGQLHIEVTVAKLKRRFGVEVNLKPPKIPYRETITASTDAHGRHKKQTGGHGQFGDCSIRMEPLPRGSDYQFVDDIFGGAIPQTFRPAVDKGIQETRLRGYLAGYPVVDFKVTLVDGKYHDVDSNELSFKMAGRLAFKDAMTRVQADHPRADHERRGVRAVRLRRRPDGRPERPPRADRGHGHARRHDRHQGSGADVGDAHLRAAADVGHRRPRLVHMEYSHYEEVPNHIQSKIIAAYKAEKGEAAEEEEE